MNHILAKSNSFSLQNKINFRLKVIAIVFTLLILALFPLAMLNSRSVAKSFFSSAPAEYILDPAKLAPLYPNSNNDKTLDRINLVVAFSDQIPSNIDYNLAAETILQSAGQGLGSSIFGFFTISPFKENINKFNIWVYNQPVTRAEESSFSAAIKKSNNPLNLNYATSIYIDKQTTIADRAYSETARIIEDTLTKQPKFYQIGSVDRIFLFEPDNSINSFVQETLAHEMGHSIFGLTDEYVETNNKFFVAFKPSCAINSTMASDWWGDLDTQVDPFYTTFTNKRASLGLTSPAVSQITIGQNTGVGCLSDVDSGQIKATKNSLMNNQYQLAVPGSVNLRQINKILNLFSGTTTLNPKPVNNANIASYVYSDNELNLDKVSSEGCKVNDDTTNSDPNIVLVTCKLSTSQVSNPSTLNKFHWQLSKTTTSPGSLNSFEITSGYKSCNLSELFGDFICQSQPIDKSLHTNFQAVYYFDAQEYYSSEQPWDINTLLNSNNLSSSSSISTLSSNSSSDMSTQTSSNSSSLSNSINSSQSLSSQSQNQSSSSLSNQSVGYSSSSNLSSSYSESISNSTQSSSFSTVSTQSQSVVSSSSNSSTSQSMSTVNNSLSNSNSNSVTNSNPNDSSNSSISSTFSESVNSQSSISTPANNNSSTTASLDIKTIPVVRAVTNSNPAPQATQTGSIINTVVQQITQNPNLSNLASLTNTNSNQQNTSIPGSQSNSNSSSSSQISSFSNESKSTQFSGEGESLNKDELKNTVKTGGKITPTVNQVGIVENTPEKTILDKIKENWIGITLFISTVSAASWFAISSGYFTNFFIKK
jgi:hypothetical protein